MPLRLVTSSRYPPDQESFYLELLFLFATLERLIPQFLVCDVEVGKYVAISYTVSIFNYLNRLLVGGGGFITSEFAPGWDMG
ncbi:unnamed protein product [Rotaria magnacalcarata]|uniref:Uncharacterized protein n=1 Tax=Rotaria magnacalcarata TaxID=392030 RepID=A0A819WJW9_9BILA|nr:unnamed protein product [Rotaria magnacalcarata]